MTGKHHAPDDEPPGPLGYLVAYRRSDGTPRIWTADIRETFRDGELLLRGVRDNGTPREHADTAKLYALVEVPGACGARGVRVGEDLSCELPSGHSGFHAAEDVPGGSAHWPTLCPAATTVRLTTGDREVLCGRAAGHPNDHQAVFKEGTKLWR